MVLCGRQLCGHEIGVLQHDDEFVFLRSYRIGNLRFLSSVTEVTPFNSTTVFVNQLMEVSEPNISSGSEIVIAEADEGYFNLNEASNYNNLMLTDNVENYMAEAYVENDVMLPNNAVVSIAHVDSTSSDDILERLVAEILDDDDFNYSLNDQFISDYVSLDEALPLLEFDLLF